jgi:broad specificity phosphatase PhoE
VLILLRHGRTAANASGLLQGRSDLSLDEVGVEQAREVAAAIGRVDRVISSPLPRARETAAAFGVPHSVDERWIELDYGVYEGRPMAQVPASVWALWRSDPMFAPENGETMGALDQRVREACRDALQIARDEIVVVVSHVSPIKAAVAWALGGDISMSWRCHLEQAGVCRIAWGTGGPVLRSFNEVLYQRDAQHQSTALPHPGSSMTTSQR